MNQHRIVPSIASADQLALREELARVAFIGHLHVDIEDGNFIPNITFGMKTVRAVAGVWQGSIDVHLLVSRPENYIDDLLVCTVGSIAFQVEAVQYPLALLRRIQAAGVRAGIAINPSTPISCLDYVLPSAEYVILMSAEPDGLGQQFLPSTYDRVEELRDQLGERELFVDGGIGRAEAVELWQRGANTIVMGRAVFSAVDCVAFVNGTEQALKHQ